MRRLLVTAFVVAVLALVFYLAVITVQIHQQSARDEARPADVIIVLGAAEYRGRPSPVLKARLDHGLDLYRRKLAPRILTTGGAGGDPDYTEGGVGRAYLTKNGVRSEDIILEPEGESTMHSTAAAAEIMRRMDLRSCILVSDGYHIFRAKKMLEFKGITVHGSPRAVTARDHSREWWLDLRQAVGYLLWMVGITI